MLLDMRYHTWTRIQFMNEEALGQQTDFNRCREKFVFIRPKPTIKMKKYRQRQ